jgi:hypothetical protein
MLYMPSPMESECEGCVPRGYQNLQVTAAGAAAMTAAIHTKNCVLEASTHVAKPSAMCMF